MRSVFVVLACACLLAGCGDEPEAPDVPTLVAQAEALSAQGDTHILAARKSEEAVPADELRAQAVDAWRRAAKHYRDAFRLIDPVPVEKEERAMLAFRIGRSLAKAAVHGTNPKVRAFRIDHAQTWLAQAGRLLPDMRSVHYERGLIHESDIESVHDPIAARAGFARYLALVEKAGSVPESERARIEHAKARLEALTPVKAPK